MRCFTFRDSVRHFKRRKLCLGWCVQKIENKTDCLFISDNLRAKNSLGFPDKLLWFVVTWRFTLLGSIHSADETLQQIRHCEHGRPQKFFQGGKVDILLIFFSLLAMQRKWTYTKKCPMLRQQLHTVFSL